MPEDEPIHVGDRVTLRHPPDCHKGEVGRVVHQSSPNPHYVGLIVEWPSGEHQHLEPADVIRV